MKNNSVQTLMYAQLKTIEKLKRSNDSLEKFAYVCAHDMRQPLRTISSYMQLIAAHHAGCFDATSLQYFENAILGIERMDVLIKNVLHSSITASETNIFTHVNLNETFQHIQTDLFARLLETGGFIMADNLPTVCGNKTQMYQLFLNLIDNAIKFKGLEPLEISISATEDETSWCISVADNGIGIDPKDTEAVFEMFTRLDPKHEASGSGIGLHICKKIVDAHEGSITISDNPTGGCVFQIKLPKNLV